MAGGGVLSCGAPLPPVRRRAAPWRVRGRSGGNKGSSRPSRGSGAARRARTVRWGDSPGDRHPVPSRRLAAMNDGRDPGAPSWTVRWTRSPRAGRQSAVHLPGCARGREHAVGRGRGASGRRPAGSVSALAGMPGTRPPATAAAPVTRAGGIASASRSPSDPCLVSAPVSDVSRRACGRVGAVCWCRDAGEERPHPLPRPAW